MRPVWKKSFTAAVSLALAMTSLTSAATLDLQSFKTHSRLVVDVDASIDTVWTDQPGGFTLLLKGLTLADLQMGADAMAALRDQRLASVSAEEVGGGLQIRGTWSFPAGERAPADPQMEKFQYREKTPSKLLVDFWPKEGPTRGELNSLKLSKAKAAAVRQAEESARRRQKRRSDLEQALKLQEDVGRFCREPMKDGVDVFLPFQAFHEKFDVNVHLPEGAPDEGFQYLQPSADAPEAKYVNLALDLYRSEKFALAIRTLDFFAAEMPKSNYQREMKFLRANAVLKLGQTAAAHALLLEVKESQVGKPASLYAGVFLARLKLKTENHLAALEDYLWLAQNYPAHRLTWVFHMVAAEALYSLKQTDRAVEQYEWVMENAITPAARAEAATRVGDAYLARRQYDRALASYFRATEKFPAASAERASLQINRAESLYWLGQYDRSEGAFVNFLKKFPGHPAGWRANLRLGEITGRATGVLAVTRSREYFLNTINHHPFSPGATLARLRLLPCGDHGGFSSDTAKAFFAEEAQKYSGGDEVIMENYGDLRAMLRVRTMILLDDTTAAVDATMEEQAGLSKKSAVGKWIADMQRQLFRKSILQLLEAGKKFEAVQFYDSRITRVDLMSEEEESGRVVVDPDYLLRLSRAASDLGLGKVAQKISSDYERANSAFIVARGIASGPTEAADLDSRLKASERKFTNAKALWVSRGVAAAAEIRPLLESVIDESPFSFQREIILGQLDLADGKSASALRHATSARLLLAQLGVTEYTRDHASVDQWIVKLQITAGQPETALSTLRSLQDSKIVNERFLSRQLKLPVLESREDWILTEAQLLEKSSRWGEAATAYEKLVHEGRGGNRAQVQLALALEKTGRPADISRSNELMQKVSESPTQDFWKELARKAIASRNESHGGLDK